MHCVKVWFCTLIRRRCLQRTPSRTHIVKLILMSVWHLSLGEHMIVKHTWPKDFHSGYLRRGFSSLGCTQASWPGVGTCSLLGPKRPRSLQHDHSGTLPPPVSTNSPTHTGPLISMTILCCRGVSMERLGMSRGAPVFVCVRCSKGTPSYCTAAHLCVWLWDRGAGQLGSLLWWRAALWGPRG